MILKELVQRVLTKVKLDINDKAAYNHCRASLIYSYNNIWNTINWRDALSLYVVPNCPQIVTLPHNFQTIQVVTWDFRRMFDVDEPVQVMKFTPQSFNPDQPKGSPYKYMIESPPLALFKSPAGSRLILKSSSANDVGTNVRVVGVQNVLAVSPQGNTYVTNRLDVEETLILQGTSPVTTVNAFDDVKILSKDATNGTVTITDVSNNTLGQLLSYENQRKHYRIKVIDAPSLQTKTLCVIGKVYPYGFTDDYDSPMLPGSEQVILEAAEAEMLEYDQQYQKADAARARAKVLLDAAIAQETAQMVTSMRVDFEPYIGIVRGSRSSSLWLRQPYMSTTM